MNLRPSPASARRLLFALLMLAGIAGIGAWVYRAQRPHSVASSPQPRTVEKAQPSLPAQAALPGAGVLAPVAAPAVAGSGSASASSFAAAVTTPAAEPRVQQRLPLAEADKLLATGQLIERQRSQPDSQGRVREVSLYRTAFKYPLVRVEESLVPDASLRAASLNLKASAQAQAGYRREWRHLSVADHAMVRFPESVTEANIQAWAAQQGFTVRRKLRSSPIYLVSTPRQDVGAADAILNAYRAAFPSTQARSGQAPAVAERDYLVFPSRVPSDSSFSQLWGMKNTGQNGGVADADIDADEAWDIATGSRSVVVGIIDTGLSRSHPDLAANAWTNPREIANNGIDDDRNGYTDDTIGWDFYSNDANPNDEDGHGSHCAGTIGGVGNNGTGVAGVNWQVSMVGLRFLGTGGGSTSDAIEAIDYATGLGMALTSNSWGGGGYSALLKTAIDNAGTAGMPFVAAAGNDGDNIENVPSYPASYTSTNIISVASSTSSDTMSSFSNYGATSVDLAAPGSGIYSTVLSNGYDTYNGTSMATPHVSGAIALVKSVNPNLTVAELKANLLSTVDPLSAFASRTVSGGRLNLLGFLAESAGPSPVIQRFVIAEAAGGNGDGIINPGESFTVALDMANVGTEQATDVVATVALGSSTQFTASRTSITVGTLAPGATITPTQTFAFSSASGTPTPVSESLTVTLNYNTFTRTQPLLLTLRTSSRIAGRVTAADGSGPLSSAKVSYTGPRSGEVTTDSDGRYEFIAVDGTHSLIAQAPGFLASARSVTTPPATTGVDFALRLPFLRLDPTAVSLRLNAGDTAQQTIALGNRDSAALTWSLRMNYLRQSTSQQTLYKLAALPAPAWSPSEGGVLANLSKPPVQASPIPAQALPLDTLTGVSVGLISYYGDSAFFGIGGDVAQRGGSVTVLARPISASRLANVQVVVLDDAANTFDTSERDALQAWIRAGGSLFGTNDQSATSMNALLSGSGIEMFTITGFPDYTLTDVRSHPITAGITSVFSYSAGAMLTLSGGAQPLLLTSSGSIHAAASQLGSGTVVVVGNEITDAVSFSLQTRQFCNQVIDYLAGQSHGWVAATPEQGSLVGNGTSSVRLDFDSADLLGGTYEAEGRFVTNDPAAPLVVLPISMRVVGSPAIRASVASLDFGHRVQGNTRPITLTITNPGSDTLEVSSVMLEGAQAGAFTLSSAAAFNLAPQGSRTLQFTFIDDTLGSYSAELVLASNATSTPTLRVPILANRTLAPDISVTPLTATGAMRQGETRSYTFTVANAGPGILDWAAAVDRLPSAPGTSPAAYTLHPSSGSITARGTATVLLTVDGSRLYSGLHAPVVHFESQDPDSPDLQRQLTLKVTAAPAFSVSPTSLAFAPPPDIYVFGSAFANLTVTNTSDAIVQLKGSISNTPAFRVLTRFPITLQPGGAATLEVQFKPSKAGTSSGFLSLLSNTSARRFFIPVSGEAIPGPEVRMTPAKLSLTAPPGMTTSHSVLLENPGVEPLTWTATASGPGLQMNADSLSGTLAPGGSQTLHFTENTTGLNAGTTAQQIAINSNAPRTPQLRLPIAMKVSAGSAIAATPEPLAFGTVWQGINSLRNLRLINTGNRELRVRDIVETNPAVRAAGLAPFVIPAGSYQELPVNLQTNSLGSLTASIVILSDAANQPDLVIPITAEVVMPPGIVVDPTSLSETLDPGQSVTRRITLTNPGGDALTWRAEQLMNSWASTVAPSSGAIPPGQTGSLDVTFNAGTLLPTTYTQPIQLSSNAPGRSTVTIPLSLTVNSRPILTLSPTALAFGSVFQHGSRTLSFSLKNTGNATLTLTSLSTPGAAFSVPSFTFPYALSPGSSRAGTLVFAPTEVATADGSLTFTTREAGTATINVTAAGIAGPEATISPTSLTTTVDPGSNTIVPLTLSNIGVATLTWSAAYTGMGAVANLSPSTLSGSISGGNTGEIRLVIAPGSMPASTYTGNINITTNDPRRPTLTVPVSITVTSRPSLSLSPASLAFPTIFAHGSTTLSVVARNNGNAPLVLSSFAPSDASLSFTGTSFPLTINTGAQVTLSARWAPTTVGPFTGSFTFATNVVSSPSVTLPVTGSATHGPTITVDPTSIAETLDPGQTRSVPITLSNSGGADLHWSTTMATSTNSDTLENVLAQLNAKASTITAVIPSRYDFSEGVTGNNISDGGYDMYDGGNYLSTSLGSNFSYSDNAITTTAATGIGGRYFTRKHAGLFTFVADLVSATSFSISGNLGADGDGSYSVSELTRVRNGVTYRGYIKRVYGAGDPSVNHLIIVADRGGLARTYSTSTNSDAHSINGLSGSTRICYVLFATSNGSQVNDSTFGTIMDHLLPVVYPGPNWASISRASGTITPGSNDSLSLTLNAGQLAAGDHTTTLSFTSDDPQRPSVDVPVTLTVGNISQLAAAPNSLAFPSAFANEVKALSLRLTSSGNGPVTVTSITGSDPAFRVAPGTIFPLVVPANNSRDVLVHFSSPTVSSYTGSFTIASDSRSLPSFSVPATGTATAPPVAEVSPASITRSLDLNQSIPTSVTLTNAGTVPMTWSALLQGLGPIGDIGTPPSGTLAPGQFTGIPFTLRTTGSTAAGTYNGRLVITTNDPLRPTINLPVTVTVASRPAAQFSTSVLAFPSTVADAAHPTQAAINVQSTGNAPLIISSLSSPSGAFSLVSPALPLNVAVGQSALLTFAFSPSAPGLIAETLTFQANTSAPPSFTATGQGLALAVSPGSISRSALPGATASITASLALATASPATAWTASSAESWISLGQSSGTGPSSLTVTLAPASLSAGTHTGSIVFTSGSQTLSVPVTLSLIGNLNIPKLQADDTLPVVYGMHHDLAAPNASRLLWIDPSTAAVTHTLDLGGTARDFTHHAVDDRLYVLMADGATVKRVERQGAKQILGSWTSTATGLQNIVAGPAGRVVTKGTSASGSYYSAVIMRDSATGATTSSRSDFYTSNIYSRPSGSSFYLVFNYSGSTTSAGIAVSVMTASSFYSSSARESSSFPVLSSSPFTFSADGQRLFFASKTISASNFATVANFPAAIFAASPSGAIAYGSDKAYDGSTGQTLFNLPASSTVMAATPDASALVLFDARVRILRTVNTARLISSPTALDFGSIPAGSTSPLTLAILNSTNQDLTVGIASSNPLFTPSTPSQAISRGQRASITVAFAPSALGSQSGQLQLSVSGQPALAQTIALSGIGQAPNVKQTVTFNAANNVAPWVESGIITTVVGGMQIIPAGTVGRCDNGTRHVAFASNQSPITFTRSGGGAFDALSVDLGEYSHVFIAPTSVTFTGTKAGGSTVSTTFIVDGIFDGLGGNADFQTFNFPSTFTGLTSLYSNNVIYSLDNLVVSMPPATTTAIASTSPTFPAQPGNFDIDGDGQLDTTGLSIIDSLQTSSDGALRTHRYSYTRRAGLPAAAFVIEASTDGASWTDLVPDLDYQIDRSTANDDGTETLEVRIPAETAQTWQFRLSVRP